MGVRDKNSLKVNLAAPSPERKGMVLGCVGKKVFPSLFLLLLFGCGCGPLPLPLPSSLPRGSTGEQETWCCTHTDATIAVSRHFSRARAKKVFSLEMNCRCLSVINYFPLSLSFFSGIAHSVRTGLECFYL